MFTVKSKFLLPLAFVAALSAGPVAHAEDSLAMLVVTPAMLRAEAQVMAERYAEGLRLRAAGDNYRAFLVFHEAAQLGHPKAQRRLGEIYDSGDAIVQRDYLKALRWYQAAREQGEAIPAAGHRGYGPVIR
jgi:TPR repeat protein